MKYDKKTVQIARRIALQVRALGGIDLTQLDDDDAVVERVKAGIAPVADALHKHGLTLAQASTALKALADAMRSNAPPNAGNQPPAAREAG